MLPRRRAGRAWSARERRRAIVKSATVAPKSRHGARVIPLTRELAATLRASASRGHRRRVGLPGVAAAVRAIRAACAAACSSPPPNARDWPVSGSTRCVKPAHRCSSSLSPLRLQRWLGHHSPAFTLETYGHLIDDDLGPALDLRKQLPAVRSQQTTPAARN